MEAIEGSMRFRLNCQAAFGETAGLGNGNSLLRTCHLRVSPSRGQARFSSSFSTCITSKCAFDDFTQHNMSQSLRLSVSNTTAAAPENY